MTANYALSNAAEQLTPSMVFYTELIRKNIAAVIALAGSPSRLRPHVKTHKTIEIVQMLLAAGVTAHKCATIAEAELLAMAGATDVLIAYPLVGPNIARLFALKVKYPQVRFSSLVDHPVHLELLSKGAIAAKATAEFVLDVDVGQHRTGVGLDAAGEIYRHAAKQPGLQPAGLQAYDGHNHQENRADRDAAVAVWLKPVLALRTNLEAAGLAVPRIVVGGTPTFPVLAANPDVSGLECSPGTFVLYDNGYGSKYDDLSSLTPAAVLLTRVISKPTPTRVTFDLGNKSVAADPLLKNRVKLLDAPPYETVGHNEEHLIIETVEADRYQIGDVVYALPGHVCPSVALHKSVLIAEGGRVTGSWVVLARDRVLTV
ncbi:D-TA family PLP-dependent enzyme [soil metagenome]